MGKSPLRIAVVLEGPMMPSGLLMQMLMNQRQQSIPDMPPQPPPWYQLNMLGPSGQPPPQMAYRDPMQAGPQPSQQGHLTMMYGKGQ